MALRGEFAVEEAVDLSEEAVDLSEDGLRNKEMTVSFLGTVWIGG
jgi:hypothetical protein